MLLLLPSRVLLTTFKPEMIESFNVPKNKVARWAGITSAVFSLSQAMTGVFWGQGMYFLERFFSLDRTAA